MNLLINQIFENKEAAALPCLPESGGLPALVSGLSAVHRANLAAALRDRTGAPLFVICPDDTAAENFANDLRAMLGEDCRVLGMRDFTFYAAEAVSRQAEQKRLDTLYALAQGASPVTAVSVSGLLQRTIPPETLRQAAFTIEDGGSYPIEDVEDALLRCGYGRCTQVEGPGQFARRGGILDFFSPSDTEPVRIEFWGDEIDSMGRFDVSTQRRTEQIGRCTILPAAETLPTMTVGGCETLARQIESFADRYARRRTGENAAALAAVLRADAERLRGGVNMSDADRYLPVIYPPATAMDYIPADAIAAASARGITPNSSPRTSGSCRSAASSQCRPTVSARALRRSQSASRTFPSTWPTPSPWAGRPCRRRRSSASRPSSSPPTPAARRLPPRM